MTCAISIIIPVLNEAASIEAFLRALPAGAELVLVDGGSDDATVELATPFVHQIVHSDRGRAKQMNVGADIATGQVLVFLHADTSLPEYFLEEIDLFVNSEHLWGRFDVRLDSSKLVFRVIEAMMNMRSRLTAIATGDQTLFVQAETFHELGGYKDIPLMEDVEFSKRLKSYSHPFCSHHRVKTSARRWLKNGVVRTILLMWWLRLKYFFGVSPEKLATEYDRG